MCDCLGYIDVSAGKLETICKNALQFKREWVAAERLGYIRYMTTEPRRYLLFFKMDPYTKEEAEKLWKTQPPGMFEMSPEAWAEAKGSFYYDKVKTLLNVAQNAGHKQAKIKVDVEIFEYIMDRQKFIP